MPTTSDEARLDSWNNDDDDDDNDDNDDDDIQVVIRQLVVRADLCGV